MVKTKFLKTNQKYWNQVDQQSRYLVADTLNKILPLSNLRDQKNFDLAQDTDYTSLLAEYENNYSATENLPSSDSLAEEIAYEYLLLVVKSLLHGLSDFNCHLPDYFTGLTEY